MGAAPSRATIKYRDNSLISESGLTGTFRMQRTSANTLTIRNTNCEVLATIDLTSLSNPYTITGYYGDLIINVTAEQFVCIIDYSYQRIRFPLVPAFQSNFDIFLFDITGGGTRVYPYIVEFTDCSLSPAEKIETIDYWKRTLNGIC